MTKRSEQRRRKIPRDQRLTKKEFAQVLRDDIASIRAIFLGAKPGAICMGRLTPSEACAIAKEWGCDLKTHRWFVYRPDLLKARLRKEFALRKIAGWDMRRSVESNLEQALTDESRRHAAFGLLTGYPASAILGFIHEHELARIGSPPLYLLNLLVRRTLPRHTDWSGIPRNTLRALRARMRAEWPRDDAFRKKIARATCGGQCHDRPFLEKVYRSIGAPKAHTDFLLSRRAVRIHDDQGDEIFVFVVHDLPGRNGERATDVTALRRKVRTAYVLTDDR